MRFLIVGFVLSILGLNHSSAGEIHDAARSGDAGEIARLIEKGADVNEPSPFGTALHFAVIGNQIEAARALVDHGADIDAVSEALGTPLQFATRDGKLDLAIYFIEAGAALDATDKNKFTALHFAAWKGRTQIAEALVNAGADATALAYGPSTGVFERGLFEPLQLSEKHGHDKVSELLRAAGGGPRQITPIGNTIEMGNAAKGRETIRNSCLKCHVIELGDPTTGNIYAGPSIVGIFGRAVASVDGFDYSPALTAYGGEWTEERLYSWILHPMLTVPGVLMPEAKGFSAEDAANVVAFLKAAGN